MKAFAEQMASDHGAANTELMALADSRDLDVPAMPPVGEDPAMAEMETLSGEAFDEAYVDLMVAEHEKPVAPFAAGVFDPALVGRRCARTWRARWDCRK